jgi:hypothetical protein
MNIGEVKVGMRFFHRTVKHGGARIVVVRELSDKSVSYTYEDDGHTSSTQLKDFRREDRFRPAGDAPARPLPRVELRSPPPGAEPEVVTREAAKPKAETPSTEIVTFSVEGWSLGRITGNAEALIRDVDLAERLGYERPRTIRDLIKRVLGPVGEDGKIPGIHVRRTVQRTSMPRGGHREETIDEYWLTQAQALKVSARAETAPADALLDEMVHVFLLAVQGKLPGQQSDPRVDQLVGIVTTLVAQVSRLVERADAPRRSPSASSARHSSPEGDQYLALKARGAGAIHNDRVGWLEHAYAYRFGAKPAEGAARAALFAQGINPIGPPKQARRSQNPNQQNLRGVDR